MSNTNKAGDTLMLNRNTVEFVLEYIREEMESLFSLSAAVAAFTAVKDTKNPKDNDNITAFRLAEILEERLGSTAFQNNIRSMLGVEE